MNVEEVKKAMLVIRNWCENRDAVEGRCNGCPMCDNCGIVVEPCDWEIKE